MSILEKNDFPPQMLTVKTGKERMPLHLFIYALIYKARVHVCLFLTENEELREVLPLPFLIMLHCFNPS